PGDTVDSVRRGLDCLCSNRLYSSVQVFNLSVLPGTAFRQEAQALGLTFQPRPPYYVLGTPTLRLEDCYDLMREAEERLGIEYDPLPAPALDFAGDAAGHCVRVDCDDDGPPTDGWPACSQRMQCLTLWLRSRDFHAYRARAADAIEQLLADNPFTTLQVVFEPTGDPRRLSAATLEACARACFRRPTYLDRFYAVQPGGPKAAKRLVVAAPREWRQGVGREWIDLVGEYGTLVWRGSPRTEEELEAHEVATAS
ncbi:MAG TPA: hypothetical protein VGX76_14250, partial [Pirellulales bacterium]|nr:hypothetical protein [Pirellulales bacterium]